jgi:hypothetical protein
MRPANFLLLVLAIGCASCKAESPELEVRNRLMSLAGKPAMYCGRASTPAQISHSSKCAQEAFANRRAFYVQYDVMGTDARTEEGLAFDSHGTLSHVWTISWSSLSGGKPSGKFEVHTCTPKTLHKLANDELMCNFPVNP